MNRCRLSLIAACRIRPSALCRSSQPCVRNLCRRDELPLARPLPSTPSASRVVSPPLFGGFLGTMGLSDFPRSFIAVLPHQGSRRGPCRHDKAKRGISQFLRKEHPHMPGVFDRAESESVPRWRRARCSLLTFSTASALRTSSHRITRLNSPACASLVNASAMPSRAHPHDLGPVWVAGPSPCGSCIRYYSPVLWRYRKTLDTTRDEGLQRTCTSKS